VTEPLDEHRLRVRVEVMNVKVGRQGFEVGQEAVAYLPPEALVRLDD